MRVHSPLSYIFPTTYLTPGPSAVPHQNPSVPLVIPVSMIFNFTAILQPCAQTVLATIHWVARSRKRWRIRMDRWFSHRLRTLVTRATKWRFRRQRHDVGQTGQQKPRDVEWRHLHNAKTLRSFHVQNFIQGVGLIKGENEKLHTKHFSNIW